MEIAKLKDRIEEAKNKLNKLKGQKESYEKTKKDLIKSLKENGINSLGELKKAIIKMNEEIEEDTKKINKMLNKLDISEDDNYEEEED